ncbi:MAG: hypothetical protein RSD49_12025 [Hafnia sp.]
MSALIAWGIIGFITWLGIALDIMLTKGRRHQRSDLWHLPLTMIAMIMLGPTPYLFWYVKSYKKRNLHR